MPLKLRLILFYSCVALFFILLPVFLLSSLGYRYNSSTHRLERLGMISIRTSPEEASITLNNKLIKQKTPAKLANLFPGKYSLVLSKKGYRPWTGDVPVLSNWVTQLESIYLFPEKIEFIPVSELSVTSFYLSPKSRKMIVWGGSSGDAGLWLIDLLLDEETLVLDEKQIWPGFLSKDIEIHWSKDERAVLIQKGNEIFLLDFKKPNRILNLKDLLGFNPDAAAWSDKSADAFYFLSKGVVGKYSFRKKKKEDNLLNGVQHFQISDGLLYGVGATPEMLWRFSEDVPEKISSVLPDDAIDLPEGIQKAFRFDSSKLIFVNQKKAYLHQTGPKTDSYTQEIFSFPDGWDQIDFDKRFKQMYFTEGGHLMRVSLAQGPVNKLMQNMRDTVSDGMQLINEIGQSK